MDSHICRSRWLAVAFIVCLLALLVACGQQKKVCVNPPTGANIMVPIGAEERARREREDWEQDYERCLREQEHQVP